MVWWIVCFIIVLVCVYAVIPNIILRLFGVRTLQTVENRIALTFDDGPDVTYTPMVLDVLKSVGIYATFFVISTKAERHPEIILRMISEGHEVQVHGETHRFVPWLLPRQTIRQIATSAEKLQTMFQIDSQWYRPTWGLCNLASVLYLRNQTHRLITWSIMVGDWRKCSATELTERIVKRLHPGAIIVLHDSDETFGAEKGAPEAVALAIPQFVESAQNCGYTFCTLGGWRSQPGR